MSSRSKGVMNDELIFLYSSWVIASLSCSTSTSRSLTDCTSASCRTSSDSSAVPVTRFSAARLKKSKNDSSLGRSLIRTGHLTTGIDQEHGSSPADQPPPLRLDIEICHRIPQGQIDKRVPQEGGHRPVPVPLPVGRDDVPRCVPGRAPRERVGVGRLVGRPERALGHVTRVVLPVLGRVGQPHQQPLALLLGSDVPHYLQHWSFRRG